MNDRKHILHCLMERRFGSRSCHQSHLWLKQSVGKCHVADCTSQQVDRAISKLNFLLKHSRQVRESVWDRLERERHQGAVMARGSR
jgi:hypothetical protein